MEKAFIAATHKYSSEWEFDEAKHWHICINCDGIDYESVEEHTKAEYVVENIIESSCIEKGHYDKVIYCEICKAELNRTTMETPLKNHHLTAHE